MQIMGLPVACTPGATLSHLRPAGMWSEPQLAVAPGEHPDETSLPGNAQSRPESRHTFPGRPLPAPGPLILWRSQARA